MLTGKVKNQGNIEFAKKLEDKVKNEYLLKLSRTPYS